MKLVIISPPFQEGGQKSKGIPLAPPILEYLAGLTIKIDPDIDIELVDANKEDFNPFTIEADLIGITVLTPQAPWAYRMGDILLSRNIQVVFGGIHVTALPEEAKAHADSVVVGEAESVWKEVLDDARERKLKPYYNGVREPLIDLPRPKHGLLKSKYRMGSFFTTRGCPHHCTFCSVRKFFGDTVRLRPIDEVVKEVASSPWRIFWNLDDNCWGADINRSIELFKEMSRNIKFKYWFATADLASVQSKRGDELLKWARKAGMTMALVGWETDNPQSLKEYAANTKQGRNRRDAIKRIKSFGIDVMLFVIVGGRFDDLNDYLAILEECDKLNVSAHPTMLTPFPGTDIYYSYKDKLIDDVTWDKFDGNHAVFDHDNPLMSISNREEALLWLRAELFSWSRVLKRVSGIPLKGFPSAHMTSFMIQFGQGKAFKEYASLSKSPLTKERILKLAKEIV